MSARAKAAALVTAAALGVAACGDSDDTASTTEPAAPAAPASTTTAPAKPAPRSISKDLATKPEIPKPTGDPPSKLVVKDIVKGKGKAAAKAGSNVTVQYVGVSYSTGQQFDASWDRGQPFEFQLGDQRIIRGWNQGMMGMKKGGRRELIIPPDLAYGAQGQPGIAPNETLVFVIDLVRVG